eukprot:m.259731 g.259731  ORF g.259731 m.259731 type:complete len:67 (-) comp17589_c0_seq5:6368-6568(-)
MGGDAERLLEVYNGLCSELWADGVEVPTGYNQALENAGSRVLVEHSIGIDRNFLQTPYTYEARSER